MLTIIWGMLTIRFFRTFPGRKGEEKGGALADTAFCPDLTAVGLYYVFGDCQAKAGARFTVSAAGARLVHLIETLEDAVQVVGRDARACVADAYFNCGFGCHLGAAAWRLWVFRWRL